MTRWAVIFSVSALASQGAAISADSARGAALFQSLACIDCHSINGKGGRIAPDLGRAVDRNFTPASLAATMWNHAPSMWAAMRDRNVSAGDLNEQAAADLFAYFYSARFFEHPGDAGRGKNLFVSKHCVECHGITTSKLPQAKPASQWESTNQPMALVSAMWNHSSTMRQEFTRKHLPWPSLNAQELEDMLVYLRNLPGARAASGLVEITAGANGRALLDSKGCSTCHTGRTALGAEVRGKTLTDIAAGVWNHRPGMPAAAQISPEEMREIASYLWAEEFFKDQGSRPAGERVFAAKHCARCHSGASAAAPQLTGAFTAARMVSALWHHGPAMLRTMQSENIPWPRFEGREMSNLIAYLNAAKKGP